LYEKSEADEFFEELERFISTDEYGDSDTDSGRNTRNYERQTASLSYVGITNDKFTETVKDEHQEKSPGFGDFF